MNINDIELHAGIHTLYIVTDDTPNNNNVKGVSKIHSTINQNTGVILHGMKINPNKYLYGDHQYINSYSEYARTIDEMMRIKGIEDYRIQRVDFRIDNYNNTFDNLYKLNNAIVHMLAMSLNIDNRYKSSKGDMPHNIVARNSTKEIECYNRIEKEGEGLTKTRLELRQFYKLEKAVYKDSIINICEEWIRILNNKLMSMYYSRFQTEQTRRICQEWRKGTENGTIRNHIDLIARNKNYIYTSDQMNKVCNGLGLATDVGYVYRCRIGIEYYKLCDIMQYIEKITDALNIFLTS